MIGANEKANRTFPVPSRSCGFSGSGLLRKSKVENESASVSDDLNLRSQ